MAAAAGLVQLASGWSGSQEPVLPGASGVQFGAPTCWVLVVRAWLPPRPLPYP